MNKQTQVLILAEPESDPEHVGAIIAATAAHEACLVKAVVAGPSSTTMAKPVPPPLPPRVANGVAKG